MAYQNKFTFVGKLKFPKAESKRPFHAVISKADEKDLPETKRTWEGHKLNFFMEVSKNNGQFAEIFAGWKHATKEIKSWSKGSNAEKGSELLIPASKRMDADIIDMVADFKKFKVNLGEEKTFITDYDFAKYLAENLQSVGDNTVMIKGDFKVEESKGKFYKKFIPTSVIIVPEDTKCQFKLNADIYFNGDSFTDIRFDESNFYDIAGYVEQYEGKDLPNKFYPVNFVIDASKVDMKNENHIKRLAYLKNIFSVSDSYHHIPWEINVFRGADQVEFTIDMLTDSQREQVEFGIREIESFRRDFNGETVELYKLAIPLLDGVFKDGAIDTGMEPEDFLAKIKGSSVEIANTNEKLTKPVEEDDDLFN